jgi:hypothetical protein
MALTTCSSLSGHADDGRLGPKPLRLIRRLAQGAPRIAVTSLRATFANARTPPYRAMPPAAAESMALPLGIRASRPLCGAHLTPAPATVADPANAPNRAGLRGGRSALRQELLGAGSRRIHGGSRPSVGMKSQFGSSFASSSEIGKGRPLVVARRIETRCADLAIVRVALSEAQASREIDDLWWRSLTKRDRRGGGSKH